MNLFFNRKIRNYWFLPKIVDFLKKILSGNSRKTKENSVNIAHNRDVGDGWAGWVIIQSGCGRSVNPISTRGGRLCPLPPLLLAHPDLGIDQLLKFEMTFDYRLIRFDQY